MQAEAVHAACSVHARSRRRTDTVQAPHPPLAGQAQWHVPTRLPLSPHPPGMQKDAGCQRVHPKKASPAFEQTVRVGKKRKQLPRAASFANQSGTIGNGQSHLAKQVPNHNEKKYAVFGSPGDSPPPPVPVTPRARRLSRRSPIRRRCPPSCLSCRWCCSAPPRGCNG